MIVSALQKISRLCQNSGGTLKPSELSASFERSLTGHGRACNFMFRDEHLLLDKLRESFLPDSPKVFGNRLWMNLYLRQLDVPKAREFFGMAGMKNSFAAVEDWQGQPHPSFQICTEPGKFRTADNRPVITLRVLCKPDGSFHSALVSATDGAASKESLVSRVSHPVDSEAAWQVLSMLIRNINPSLGTPDVSREISRW